MYFDEDFVKSLPDDWNYVALRIKEKLDFYLQSLDPKEQYLAVEQLWVLLKVLEKRGKHSYKVSGLSHNKGSDINMIKSLVQGMALEADRQIQRQTKERELNFYENIYEIALGNVFHFEFSEGDIDRIQKLINELRDLITKSEEIENKHKQRLLRKLERFQSEIHKKVSDLDRVWGFLIEGSLVIGQMGENAKPMVDRIRELMGIIGPTSARAYELPSNLPIKLLGQSEEDKSTEKSEK